MSLTAASFAWAFAGCSLDETTSVPACHRLGSIVIVAQSVPGAAFVPCVDDPGSGWEATSVHVDEEGTRLRLALGLEERAAAEVTFGATCDGGPGTAIVSGRSGVEAQVIAGGGRRYEFEGGCVVIRFSGGTAPEASDALVRAVVLVERDRLADDVRRTFVDADL